MDINEHSSERWLRPQLSAINSSSDLIQFPCDRACFPSHFHTVHITLWAHKFSSSKRYHQQHKIETTMWSHYALAHCSFFLVKCESIFTSMFSSVFHIFFSSNGSRERRRGATEQVASTRQSTFLSFFFSSHFLSRKRKRKNPNYVRKWTGDRLRLGWLIAAGCVAYLHCIFQLFFSHFFPMKSLHTHLHHHFHLFFFFALHQ